MDTNDTKQIIISYYTIENACDAILKPVKIELGDSETVAKMPKALYDTLEQLTIDCKAIQRVLSRMDYVSDLEESIYDDGEITQAGKMISDILFDVQLIPNQPALDELADEIFKPKAVDNLVTNPTIAKFSKEAGL